MTQGGLHRSPGGFVLLTVLVLAACAAEGPMGWTEAAGPPEYAPFDHTATLLDNGLVLMSGGDGAEIGELTNAAARFDPVAQDWRVGAMRSARADHTATLLKDGTVLVAGGYWWEGVRTALDTAELFDPATNSFRSAEPMAQGRSGHTATLLPNGKVLVVGGYTSRHANPDVVLDSVELYDPLTGHWTVGAGLAEARYFHTATLLTDGRVLVIGGRGNRLAVTSAEIYDPDTGAWTDAGDMAGPRYLHTATLLTDGKVLVAGGGDVFHVALASAEIYDPEADTWTVAAPMAGIRVAHAASILGDGTVLVMGGINEVHNGATNSAERYDPETNAWTAAASMPEPRSRHTATLLPDQTVLVFGGGPLHPLIFGFDPGV